MVATRFLGPVHSLIGIIGMPHGGTAELGRMLARLDALDVAENPYQARHLAGNDAHEPDFQAIAAEAGLTLKPRNVLAVSETLRRAENGFHLFDMMRRAQYSGVHTVCWVVLRCPFEAYQAAIRDEGDTEYTRIDEESFERFGRSIGNLAVVCRYARMFTYRFTSLQMLQSEPDLEMPRLMASLGGSTNQFESAPTPGPADEELEAQLARIKHRFRGMEIIRLYRQLSRLVANALPGNDAPVHEELAQILSFQS